MSDSLARTSIANIGRWTDGTVATATCPIWSADFLPDAFHWTLLWLALWIVYPWRLSRNASSYFPEANRVGSFLLPHPPLNSFFSVKHPTTADHPVCRTTKSLRWTSCFKPVRGWLADEYQLHRLFSSVCSGSVHLRCKRRNQLILCSHHLHRSLRWTDSRSSPFGIVTGFHLLFLWVFSQSECTSAVVHRLISVSWWREFDNGMCSNPPLTEQERDVRLQRISTRVFLLLLTGNVFVCRKRDLFHWLQSLSVGLQVCIIILVLFDSFKSQIITKDRI